MLLKNTNQEEGYGYASIENVVKEACLELGDLNLSHYFRLENFALNCLQELNIDKSEQIITEQFTVDHMGAVDFPKSMIKWTKVGTRVGDRIKIMVTNNRIALYHDKTCAQELPNQNYYSRSDAFQDREEGYWFLNIWSNGQFYDRAYGYGNGDEHNQGQFREDQVNRRFLFSTEWINREVIIEYITTGINECNKSFVPEIAREYLKTYIKYKFILHKPDRTLGEKQMWKMLTEEEGLKVSRRMTAIDIDKILALTRNAYMGTPKNG